MASNARTRKVVKKIIDQAISMIPREIMILRQSGLKSELKIKKEDDFMLGMTWGHIISDTANYYANLFGRPATYEELSVLVAIARKRIREIKDAIHSAA